MVRSMKSPSTQGIALCTLSSIVRSIKSPCTQGVALHTLPPKAFLSLSLSSPVRSINSLWNCSIKPLAEAILLDSGCSTHSVEDSLLWTFLHFSPLTSHEKLAHFFCLIQPWMTKPSGRRELGTYNFNSCKLLTVNPGSIRHTKFTVDAEILGHGSPFPW